MWNDSRSEGACQFIQSLKISWVGDRHVQTIAFAAQWDELIPDHQVNWNLSQKRIVDRRNSFAWQQVDKRQSVSARQSACVFDFRRFFALPVTILFHNGR